MPSRPTIVLFHRNLRLADNVALSAALEADRPVIPVYCLDDDGLAPFQAGAASRWWLHHSLVALDAGLRRRGSRLVIRRGATVDTVVALIGETNAAAVHVARGYEPAARRIERALRAACTGLGVELRRYSGEALFEPERIRSQSGEPYRVFTPFWRACGDAPPPAEPLPAPDEFRGPRRWPSSDAIDQWALLPKAPDWAGGLRESWRPGEAEAAARLAAFLEHDVVRYASDRDRPDLPATSRLSPHLHFGEISPRQCWHAVRRARDSSSEASKGHDAFVREIGWREFSLHLLFHWPHIVDAPFRSEFARFASSGDAVANAHNFAAWKRGLTGYPIVDAGMRELWHTGWMHNRVRMIVASFLCKHLLLPWQDGARWFWDTLVDANVASNQASWQWVAGCGADAAPYFRVFNPVLQGAKFDRDGSYVRRYVHELAALDTSYIHAPWLAPPAALRDAGVELGRTYPRPLVDHAAARARALAAYADLKGTSASTLKSEADT
jgi:deoxyribodipyrimidine photo-lyase